MKFERKIVGQIADGLKKAPQLIHVIVGPRQVGKTTAVRQLCERLGMPFVWATADTPMPLDHLWLEMQWRHAEAECSLHKQPVLLVIDEIQKVSGWSETLKRLWDTSRTARLELQVIVLGSSALLVQKGLTESLAGRFFLHRCMHWGYDEMREAFGFSLDQWLYFGGYPGAAGFVNDEPFWRSYINDSLVETVLSRDILHLTNIHKPILLRHLLGLAMRFPAQIFSYNKMLGQINDAGNTTTLAGYLRLLEATFLLSGLELYSAGHLRRRGSSPKLIFWNNALLHTFSNHSFDTFPSDQVWYGRVLENAVGAHLLNHLPPHEYNVTYWRNGNHEMDFVVTHGHEVYGIEVKRSALTDDRGLQAFRRSYPNAKLLIIAPDAIPAETFFLSNPATILATASLRGGTITADSLLTQRHKGTKIHSRDSHIK